MRIVLVALIITWATAAATTNLTVHVGPLPEGADRFAIVIDGSGISPITRTFTLTEDYPFADVTLPVPMLDHLRVRGVVYRAGKAFPILLAAGKAEDISTTTVTVTSLQLATLGAKEIRSRPVRTRIIRSHAGDSRFG